MNGFNYILNKQTEWARSRGFNLVGSQGVRGKPAYVSCHDDNLFLPLSEKLRDSLNKGDGNELGAGEHPGKLQAIYSSSALGINVFQYWDSVNDAPAIAAACGLCKQGSRAASHFSFEEKFPINDGFAKHPNLDVVIHNSPESKIKVLAIECKFREAYDARGHQGIKPKYLEQCETLWADMPNLRQLAEDISPADDEFKYLHAAQLIKHILGLKRKFGLDGFRLLYLWYDVLGLDGASHRQEVDTFSAYAKKDRIMFHSLSYQELICQMAKTLEPEHSEYIHYLTGRYL